MLKNKKVIYLLIPLNLLIWGFFIYRIFSAFNETETRTAALKKQESGLETIKDSSNYKLSLNYKDPFLKDAERVTQTNSENNSIPQVTKKQAIVVMQPTLTSKQLPEVKYLGLIKNNSSGLSTALVSVNGQSHLVKQNEKLEGIVFKSFNKDSMVAKWGKEKIVLRN